MGRDGGYLEEDHLVPLAGVAMVVLLPTWELPQSHGVVLPSPRSADGAIARAAVRRMMWHAGTPTSPHGFGSTFQHVGAGGRRELAGRREIGLSHRAGSSVVASALDMAVLRHGLMERHTEALSLPEGALAIGLPQSA